MAKAYECQEINLEELGFECFLQTFERAMIRERTRNSLGVKRCRGERISGHVTFGWDFGSTGTLIENASEQRAIRTMQALRAEGRSYRTIAACLDGDGIAPKQGGRWQHTTVKSVLARLTRV